MHLVLVGTHIPFQKLVPQLYIAGMIQVKDAGLPALDYCVPVDDHYGVAEESLVPNIEVDVRKPNYSSII